MLNEGYEISIKEHSSEDLLYSKGFLWTASQALCYVAFMSSILEAFQRLFIRSQQHRPTVTFATSCWENDWKKIVLDPEYLRVHQIKNHSHGFDQKLLIINNVQDLDTVKLEAKKLVVQGVVDRVVAADDYEEEVLKFFQLKRSDFKAGPDAHLYENVTDDWVFYNARGILTALYFCNSDYFLYFTGDSYLNQEVQWIDKAIQLMQRKETFKVANLTWNDSYKEAKKESYCEKKGFYLSKEGFSDQCFLVKTQDFRAPIYHEILPSATQFPRGDVLEKRIFSYMKNRDWIRLTYKHGSYMHKNIQE